MPDRIDADEVSLVRWSEALVAGHAAAFAASEVSLRRWMPSASAEQADSSAFIEACIDAFDRGVTYAYAVIVSDEVAGYCNATPHGPRAEIAYWIRSDLNRRGIGSAVAQALTAATFDALPGVDRVEAHVDEANEASRRVAVGAGMTVVDSRTRVPRTAAETATELIFAVGRGERRP